MLRRLAASSRPSQGPWWPTFAAGLATGMLSGLILARRPGRALARAWKGASRRVDAMRDALQESEPLDLPALRARLAGMDGAEGLQLRDLADGILEVVGTAPDADSAAAIVDALSREPGVRVVVNRVWTPSSTAPGED